MIDVHELEQKKKEIEDFLQCTTNTLHKMFDNILESNGDVSIEVQTGVFKVYYEKEKDDVKTRILKTGSSLVVKSDCWYKISTVEKGTLIINNTLLNV